MKQAKILSLVILCITTFVWQADTFSQSLDSLLLANKNANSGIEKLNLLMKLGWKYQSSQAYSKAIEYFQNALDFKKSNDINYDELTILKNLAFCYDELQDYTNEISVYENVLNRYRENNTFSYTDISFV